MNSGQNPVSLLALAEEYAFAHAMRLTKPRKLVILQLAEVNGPITAEELWYTIRSKGFSVSMSGVYYTLHWLKKAGFLTACETEKKTVFVLKSTRNQ